jgi:thymidine kinase
MAKLYFYYSAMNAGKSAVLLQSNHNYRSNGMHTLLFTPCLDDRYAEGKITSRIGLQADAWAFDAQFDFFTYVEKETDGQQVSCILIDESQFLSKRQVLQLTLIVDRINIPVLCYGLRTDFRGEPFEGSQYLLAWADEISEIKTICRTGSKATMNARLDGQGERVWDGSQVEIGHNYVPMSRKRFDLLRASPIEYVLPIEEDCLEEE